MQHFQDYFKGKKITVMGLGLLGRGLGDIQFLATQGAELTVTDLKSADELAPSLSALAQFPKIAYTLGRHDIADFKNKDLIIKGPSVPLHSPYIAEARAQGIPVTMSSALFARFAKEKGATIVGVTGTRGKTTTTHMIAELVKAAGGTLLLGGNIQGVSTLALLPQVTSATIAVLELDSWQLQGFRDEHISPSISVFTNFFPDHMNYYNNDMDLYLSDKAQIFLHQTEKDTLVLGEDAAPIVEQAYQGRIRSHVAYAAAADIPASWNIALPGEHNKKNAACALAAARVLGIDDSVSQRVLSTFNGVPGRLQYIASVNGIAVYNDTTSTTPEATIAGLKALDPDNKKHISLIMGGADKTLDMNALIPEIKTHCAHVTLLAGTGTNRIRDLLPEARVCESLESALSDAFAGAPEGGIVLFSPAFASFGMFKNEYDRGEKFVALIKQLS